LLAKAASALRTPLPSKKQGIYCSSLEVPENFKASCEAAENHETFGVKKNEDRSKKNKFIPYNVVMHDDINAMVLLYNTSALP